jgi:hypothetical protein
MLAIGDPSSAFSSRSVRLDLVQIDITQVAHLAVLEQQFKKIIEAEVRAFDVEFDINNFLNLVDAIKSERAQACLMAASWGESQPLFIAAAVLFPSMATIWDGRNFEYYNAQYLEDICVSSKLLTRFIKTTRAHIPRDMRPGVRLVREIIQNISLEGVDRNRVVTMPSRSIIGEYANTSKSVSGILDVFNATTGSDKDSGVFEFSVIPSEVDVSVDLKCFMRPESGPTSLKYENIFALEWSEKDEHPRMTATFSKGISSFIGCTAVRVQIAGNGNYPVNERIKAVVRSLIAAGHREIQKRGWITPSTGNQYFPIRVHVLNAPQIRAALLAIGAVPRMLGKETMMPLEIDFQNIPDETLRTQVVVRPLTRCHQP